MAIIKPCPRCKSMIPAGMQYCVTCAPVIETKRQEYREHNQRKKDELYNRKRNPRYTAFYRSKEWRLTSKAFLQSAGYKCALCSGLAVEVHHIKPIQTAAGWDLRLEWSNLEALCTGCHNKRHDRGKRKLDPGIIDMHYI